MNKQAIFHQGNRFYAYPLNKETLQIKLRTGLDVQKVVLHFGDPNDYRATMTVKNKKGINKAHLVFKHPFVKFIVSESPMTWSWNRMNKLMTLMNTSSDYHYFICDVKPKNYRCKYYFEILTEEESIFFGENGFYQDDSELNIWSTFYYPFIHEKEVHQAPSWVKETVWCQLFVERFSNGDPSNDPQNVKNWDDMPVTSHSFYGGDLRGIINNLTMLRSMGFTGLYLTPIFESPSNHKYNTTDYFKIDPNFGTAEDLKELVTKAHDLEMKIMLDAVFNHSGDTWAPFLDVIEKKQESNYVDWFYFNSFEPLSYQTFANTKRMPKLNTSNESLQEYLLSILEYYLKEFKIDGWRFDVANELDHDFIRLVNKRLRKSFPECYLLGELWHDKSDWVTYDQFDAQMDYKITNNFIEFSLGNLRATELVDRLCEYYFVTPNPIQLSSFHLLDSHDTPRLLTKVNEDPKKALLALSLSLLLSGSYCLFYGTEYLLSGKMDPHCRVPYPLNPSTQQFTYKEKVVEMLKTRYLHLDSLQTIPKVEAVDDLFVMTFGDELMVVANNTTTTKHYRNQSIQPLEMIIIE